MSLPVIIGAMAGKASVRAWFVLYVSGYARGSRVWLGVEVSIELRFLQRPKWLGRLPNAQRTVKINSGLAIRQAGRFACLVCANN